MKELLAEVTGKEGTVPIWIDRGPIGEEIVTFKADLDIDADGSGGNPDHDPYFQNDTTLHGPDGKALNAQKVPFSVVPPVVCTKTKGKVLGSLCVLRNTRTGKSVDTVVGDIGPRTKTGEASPAAAVAIGIDGNANHGGTDSKIIEYTIYVGKPAVVNGVTYQLKSYGS